MQRVVFITIICFGLAVAAPQRPRPESSDTPEEMVIRLVLHVKRSEDGTQLVVDLTKSQESSSVVRPVPKPILSVSTILPIFAKSEKGEPKEVNSTLQEKSYDIPRRPEEKKISTEGNPYVVFSQTKRSVASDNSDRAAANGYINLRPQNTGTPTEYQHNGKHGYSSSKNEQDSKPKDSVVHRPVTSRPKLDFKITLGGATTERPPKFNPPKIVFPITETPTTKAVWTPVTEASRPAYFHNYGTVTTEQFRTSQESVTGPSKPAHFYHYDTQKDERTTKPPVTESKPAYFYHYDSNSTESQEETPEIELIDKAVADQGFGVLASRCESFAPGLVSDGAGGCTRPVARPKNKNYQGTYAYRSAAGNELHADVKNAHEEVENTTETSHVRVV